MRLLESLCELFLGTLPSTPVARLPRRETPASAAQLGALQAVLAREELQVKLRAAARLMRSRQYEESICAYRSIARQHPDRLARCEGEIGRALMGLERPDEAIRYFESAREHGGDASVLEVRIAQAREAQQRLGAAARLAPVPAGS